MDAIQAMSHGQEELRAIVQRPHYVTEVVVNQGQPSINNPLVVNNSPYDPPPHIDGGP